MLNNLKRRALTLLLSLAMIITYMPTSMIAYAVDGDDQAQVEKQVEAEAPAKEEAAPEAEAAEEAAPKEEPAKEAAPEEVKPEEAKSEEAAAPEEKSSEETAKPADEKPEADAKAEAEEEEDSKAEEKKPVEYTEELETVAVKVTAPADAFSEEVKLVVKPLDKDSNAFKDAEKALAENKQAYDGILAFDIHFENEKGEEVEPEGEVSVEMKAKTAILTDVDPENTILDSLQVTHIGSEATEVVADTYHKEMTGIEGTVDFSATDKEVKSIEATFDVENFSTFTLTWKNADGDDESAAVHWGTLKSDGTFDTDSEFEAATLDTTAASISLSNNYDGYFCTGAYYIDKNGNHIDVDDVLTKTATGWLTKAVIHNQDDTSTVDENHKIPDGVDIYVVYVDKSSAQDLPGPSSESEDPVHGPVVNKTVTPNGDGTQQIRLEVTAPVIPVTEQVGANVLVILDTTYSMGGTMPGATNRWVAAVDAIHTLVTALDCGTNDIDLSLVTFNRTGQVRTIDGKTWTKDYEAFIDYVDDLDYNHNTNYYGTNWEAGLLNGITALSSDERDGDATYVIFLTDGEPNRRGDGSQSVSAAQAIEAALPRAQTIVGNVNGNLYGVFCGQDSGYDNLNDMVYRDAHGQPTINGTNATAINDAFSQIASTIVSNLGSSNVSLDDGVPVLAGASAMVSGEVSGYSYEIKGPDDEDFKTWEGAPGASYSKDNGVTWDLSKVGTLAKDTTYAVEFTVWPSQEAYDIIANLNNGLVEYSKLDKDVQDQIDEHPGNPPTYSLKTNTHLEQTYTYNGETYTDPVTFEPGDMPLISYEMDVLKEWDDSINDRNRAEEVDFYLLVGGKYYQNDGTFKDSKTNAYILHTEADDWADSVQIAPGFATLKNNKLTVLETGHKYQLEEIPPTGGDYQGYSQEFTTQTARPMVINGTLTNLVLVDAHNPAPSGATTYTIDGETYYVQARNSSLLKGTNHKTAELDITKIIDASESDKTAAQLDEETFTYQVTFNVPATVDAEYLKGINYWIYTPHAHVQDKTWPLPEYGSGKPGSGYGPTDYSTSVEYEGVKSSTSASGHTVTATVQLKRNQVLRFTNLPTGTTYTIVETQANGKPLSEQGYEVASTKSTNGTSGTQTIAKDKITGEIESYNTRYYNQFTNKLVAVDAELKVTKDTEYDWSQGDETYSFQLTAEEGTPLPYKNNQTNNTVTVTSSNKTASFGTIRFTKAGTYTYTITELLPEPPNPAIIYGGPATVTVTVNADLEVTGITATGSAAACEFTEAKNGNDAIGDTTITNKWAKTKIGGEKTWDDSNGLEVTRIIVQLMEIVEGVPQAVLDEQGNIITKEVTPVDGKWTYEFADLAKYGADGVTKIVYAVKEIQMFAGDEDVTADYTADVATGVEGEDGNQTANLVNHRNKGTLVIKKSLASDSAQVTVPTGATFTITSAPKDYTGTKVFTYADFATDSDGDPTKLTITNVPTGKYVVAESNANTVEGYTLTSTVYNPTNQTASVPKNGTGTVEVINKYTINEHDVKVEKTFSGIAASDIPEGFFVTATVGTDSVTLDTTDEDVEVSEDGLTYTWTLGNVEYGTVISVSETLPTITGWTLSNDAKTTDRLTVNDTGTQKLTLTNPYTRDEAGLKITKVVANAATNETNVTAEQIGEARFEITGPADYNNGQKKTITYGEDFTNGVYTEQVPTGEYTVVEVEGSADVTGFSVVTTYLPTGGKTNVVKNGTGEVTVTNTYTQKFNDDEDEVNKPSFTVVKKDQDGEAMSGVKFTLTGSDSFKSEKTTDENGEATFNFDDFDFGEDSKGAATEEFEFTLTEEAPTGYTGAGPWTIKIGEDGDVIDIELDEETGNWHHIWNWVIEQFTGPTGATNYEWDGEELTLTVDNQINTYDLEVTKTFEGNDSNLPDGTNPYEITVTYKDVNNATQTKTLKLDDEGAEVTAGKSYKWTVSGVRYGTEATATEANTAITGYTLDTAKSVVSGKVDSIAVSGNKIDLKNVYTRDIAGLEIEKVVANAETNETDVTVDQIGGATFEITGPADYNNGQKKTITYGEDFTNGVYTEQVPTGEYTVVEVEGSADVTGFSVVTTYSPETGKTDVTKDEPGKVTVTNTYTQKFDDEEDEVNKPSFTVIKKDQDGEAMSGVKFTLTGSDSFKSEKTTGTDGKAAFNFDDFDFGEDSKGAATEEFEFTLTEEAPTGYTGAGPWTIKVGEDGDVIDIELNEETGFWHHIWNWVIEHFTKSGEEADTSEWDGEKLELTVVNQINTYDLEVTKTFEGNEGNLPDEANPYAITVTYKDVDNVTQTKTLKLDDEGAEVTAGQSYKWTVSGVRYGTEATATEANTKISGYGLDTAKSVVSGKVDSIAVSGNKIDLKNVYTHVNIEIFKTIDKLVSYDADAEVKDATFTFRIKGMDGTGKEVLNTVAAVMFNASTGTSSSVKIEKIPADIETIVVTEIDSGNYKGVKVKQEACTEENYTKTWTVSFDNTQQHGDYESGAINRYEKSGTGYVKEGTAPTQTEEGGAGDNGQE